MIRKMMDYLLRHFCQIETYAFNL